MAALSSQDILWIWESGQTQDPIGRALSILSTACPGVSRAELGRLPLGTRDARLLAVRKETFGPTAEGAASCSRCAERVEFVLDLATLRAERESPTEDVVETAGWTLRFRLPSSEDVVAALSEGEADGARGLARRCLLEASRRGGVVEEPELSEAVVSTLGAAMAARDPLAEILLDYACPACGHQGQTVFDIASFLWEEIRAEARRLLGEVHALARAYGWGEAEILTMSPARRRAYLELGT